MQASWFCLELLVFLCSVILYGYHHTFVILKQLGPTIVATKYGNVRGSLVEFPKDSYRPLQPVEAYFGIPYAALRNLRFMPPTSPLERWRRIHTATDHRPVCPQRRIREKTLAKYLPMGTVEVLRRLTTFTKDQTEDCLGLNLYVPIQEWNETENLPVMIFIHGESYEVGTGNAYDGSVLASYGGVIVVTVNYRLGVLGFLSTGDQHAGGNYALLDMLAILMWVKDNIASFGGDPNRVTLFGHGHGAALVNLLMFSNKFSDIDLFHNVILQSGSAYSTWATSIDSVRCTQLIAKSVNCSHAINNSEALVKCFREKSVDDLVRSVPLTPKYYTCFAPSVGLESMFPKGKTIDELVAAQRSVFANKNIMFGMTRKEAYSYLKQEEIEEGISEDRKKQYIRTYVQNVFKYHRQKIYDILAHEYTDWDKPTDSSSRRDNIMDLISDGQYKAPIVKMAQEHSKTADTYLYTFAYSTQSEDYPQWSGGVHGDELPYIFGAPLVGGLSPFPSVYNSQEIELSKYMMTMWSNFAKTGNPNLPESEPTQADRGGGQHFFANERWPTYNISQQKYLHIGRRGQKIKQYYRGKELALWMKLIPKMNIPDTTGSESHDLENAENISTFDDPTRLISSFRAIFPSPPPMPPYTPPHTPPQSDQNYVTTQDDIVDYTDDNFLPRSEKPYTSTPINKPRVTSAHEPVSQKNSDKSVDNSSVPLSITVAVGCSLLFLNLLIFAGVYYQRERIRKLRGDNTSHHNNIRPKSRENSKDREPSPETATSLMQMNPDPQTSSSASFPVVMNHKPTNEISPPVYSAISKPQAMPAPPPGGYTYSALSQASPMHSRSGTPPTGAVAGEENSINLTTGANSIPRPPGGGSDRSPKETRVKHVPPRSNHVTSNNAITIV